MACTRVGAFVGFQTPQHDDDVTLHYSADPRHLSLLYARAHLWGAYGPSGGIRENRQPYIAVYQALFLRLVGCARPTSQTPLDYKRGVSYTKYLRAGLLEVTSLC